MQGFLVFLTDQLISSIEEFTQYLSYVGGLEFQEDPDYNYMKHLFVGLLQKKKLELDLVFDWMLPVHMWGRKRDSAYNRRNNRNKSINQSSSS